MSEETTVEAPFARFARIYGATERGRGLWNEWMDAQTEMTRAVWEKLAADNAAEQNLSVEEARLHLALQKLIADRGVRWVEQYLHQHDLATRSLKPMTLPSRKRR